MTRGNARELALHLIYSRGFTGDEPHAAVKSRLEEEYYSHLAEENDIYAEMPTRRQVKYLDQVVAGVEEEQDALNEIIGAYSIGWDVKRISRLSRAVLQLAIYEMNHFEDVPDNVAVSEAVRLTKKYDVDSTAFVNGILGSYVRAKQTQAPQQPAEPTAEESQKPQETAVAEEF